MCQQYVQASAPARDIAFLGGLVHYILEHNSAGFTSMSLAYTNAATLINEDYQRHG